MLLKEELQEIFESEYDGESWKRVLLDVFGLKRYQMKPQEVGVAPNEWNAKGYELGDFATIEGRLVGVYEVKINNAVQLQYNKVGLRNLLKPIYKNNVDAALVVFNQGKHWRFSYVSEIRVTNKETGKRETKETDPKRYTYLFGNGQKCRTPAERFAKIQQQYNLYGGGVKLDEIEKAFSIDSLTKDFYRELSDWYFRALKEVRFPDDAERIAHTNPSEDEREKEEKTRNATSTIRLITRLIFVWFLKQKGLVPNDLFDKETIDALINYKDKTGSTYYKAILQNLFFATLNTEMGDSNRKFVDRQYGIQGYYRYKRFLKNAERFLDLTKNVPFLNGGLFENLDKNIGTKKEVRIDCFSNAKENEERLKVPDSLFFAEETVDLSSVYNDKRKKAQKVRGLINILQGYNFTIEENTPFEIEVALDPELLGNVFENLLASYVPETETTARKMTGSFYTPREIVDYMVDESLKAYLSQFLPEKSEDKLDALFSYTNEEVKFTLQEKEALINALDSANILDPACGSGAFPMGVLHKMVMVLTKLDPANILWKNLQIEKALQETEEAFRVGNKEDREQRLLGISETFEENSDDYARKLFLIENCIYGVDIQPIAVQIAKLRFFISLIVEQEINFDGKNLGVRPLPNLETKFVAANTLLGLKKPRQMLLRNPKIEELEKELSFVRHKHFGARTPKTKERWRKKDEELRQHIGELLKYDGWGNETAELVAKWNPYNQIDSSSFFDTEWMFGIIDGFDIVIGNPPYILIQNLEITDSIRKIYNSFEVAQYNGSVVFSGVNFWNENGRLEIVMQTLSTALNKVTSFVQARINNVAGLTKPQRKFLLWLFDRWLMLPVRYNFLNLGRYGGYSEKAIRSQMSSKLPFLALFHQLFAGLSKKECVAAFDPTFIAKSGKGTYGLAKYWSGTAQQVKKGLEAGCLAIVDVKDTTAYSMEVVQTPVAAEAESLMSHYTRLITQRLADIVKYTTILTVDGYFMKEGFIKAVTGVGLKVITKARQDANMLYLYKGAQHKGPGAKKKYSGKVNWKSIDKRVFKLCYHDDDMMAYEAVVWSVALKQQLKVVYVKAGERKGYEILVCSDTEIEGEKVLRYYRLRFQIEFLIRDAKTHTGLDHCQGRSEEKLYNHFNMSMMSVSVVKYQTWARLPDKEEVSFSMRTIKTYCWNQYMTMTIFANLALDMSCSKIKRLYNQCLNIGSMAA